MVKGTVIWKQKSTGKIIRTNTPNVDRTANSYRSRGNKIVRIIRKPDPVKTKSKDTSPPPPDNTVYDYVDKDSQIPSSTRKALEDAPYSPIKKPKHKKETKATYEEIEKKIQKQKTQIVGTKLKYPASVAAHEALYGSPFKKQMKYLTEQEKTISQLKEEGYHIKKEKGEYVFYKTPEQIRQEKISAQKQKIRKAYDKPSATGFLHTWTTGILSWEDPLSLKSLYYTATGQREKIIETKAKASLDLDTALKQGMPSYVVKVGTGPLASIGTAYAGGSAIGAGFGAAKTAFPVAGKVGEAVFGVGMGAYAVKETAPRFASNIKAGRYADVFSDVGMLGITSYAGYRGYKTGKIFGSGRTEAYLYRKHTYKSSSPGDIRFKEALKVSRKLENVKSHKADALDVARDIVRMDSKTADKTIEFLRQNPRTTIGGSAASYTQIEGARVPRDIDLLLPGGKKAVVAAKKWFAKTKTIKGEHLIDIHGKEFYKPGQHHMFGFRSKSPIKIGDKKFFRAGEQIFRKGIASVRKETSYRHFKDVPDFITHSKSLIESAKGRWYQRWRGLSAEKNLQRFINPDVSKDFGRSKQFSTQFIKQFTKKPRQPKRIFTFDTGGPSISHSTYAYPKTTGIYSYGALIGIGRGYFKYNYKTQGVTHSSNIYNIMNISKPKKIITYKPEQNKIPGITYKTKTSKPPVYKYVNKRMKPPTNIVTTKYTPPPQTKNILPTYKKPMKWDFFKDKKPSDLKELKFIDPSYRIRTYDIKNINKVIKEVTKGL